MRGEEGGRRGEDEKRSKINLETNYRGLNWSGMREE